MSKFWLVWLPLLLGVIIYYAYQSGGFFGDWVQGIVDPFLGIGAKVLHFVFGI